MVKSATSCSNSWRDASVMSWAACAALVLFSFRSNSSGKSVTSAFSKVASLFVGSIFSLSVLLVEGDGTEKVAVAVEVIVVVAVVSLELPYSNLVDWTCKAVLLCSKILPVFVVDRNEQTPCVSLPKAEGESSARADKGASSRRQPSRMEVGITASSLGWTMALPRPRLRPLALFRHSAFGSFDIFGIVVGGYIIRRLVGTCSAVFELVDDAFFMVMRGEWGGEN